MKKNHKWKDNKCIKCGVERVMKKYKQHMATLNHPPWDLYKYGESYSYSKGEIKYRFERPDCA